MKKQVPIFCYSQLCTKLLLLFIIGSGYYWTMGQSFLHSECMYRFPNRLFDKNIGIEKITLGTTFEQQVSYKKNFFLQETVDLGVINSSDSLMLTVSFDFLNNTDETVVITEVKSSCGCLSIDYPHRPIRTSEKGSLKVSLNLKGLKGYFRKSILVYFENASPVLLSIMGKI
ncbi:DUF1573 domain-containing protein [Bacteroidales bacterium SW292]|nr:DUF1573 domain-containing protein [Bacteroidales bacterium SW292]